ncbi:calcineurin-like phosphoesterase family protein [Janibacter sp. DB-40]|uniref:calcineurin-like phosphoesterase family protein n=1 Tax=Janibacter sp. DB-40 TaxID=3028808 RepID=UPI002405075C|nr:calcineurin-like phosphoesterase family protein [Janibacter sp. DB-40]
MAAPTATAAPSLPSQEGGSSWAETAYRGEVEVVDGTDEDQNVLDGVVFDDRNRNSSQDRGERGIPGVQVSNGRQVVTTDAKGGYELPVDDNTNVFVTQPAGYEVPVDEHNIAQFSYAHLPEGSPELRYGGIEPTGPTPDAVNFPLARSTATKKSQQNCIMGGDIQTYNQTEVEYARAGAFTDLAQRTDYASCGALFLGDIVGDDLSLYPRTRELTSMINGPARLLPGNHDLDYDAADSEHRFDTYRSQFGPDYYSYDVGDLHIVALDSVQYRAGERYSGGLGEEQLEWLRQDVAQVPKDKTVVLAAHIPLLNFNDQTLTQHQVAEINQIHEIVSGHEAVAFGGHSHTTEFMREGDSTQGWAEVMGVEELPFDHITAGAISGDWYSGRITDQGIPTALQRDGARPGVLTLESRPEALTDRFTVTGEDDSVQMAVGVNSPRYREWFEANRDNGGSAPAFEDPTVVSAADLAETTYLTANVFAGSTGTEVTVAIDGGEAKGAQRTQSMTGEARKIGALWSDPVAVQEQLVHGGSVAESSMHIWRSALPADLAAGEHTATVTSTDRDGTVSTETIEFTVTD